MPLQEVHVPVEWTTSASVWSITCCSSAHAAALVFGKYNDVPGVEVATNPVKHSLPFVAHKTSCSTKEFGLAMSHFPTNEFSPSTVPMSRIPDTLDTFTNYRYRNHTKCQISSLDLHTPFDPLCSNRAEMLTAISGGGRVGKEAPFMPRGCDMRWFSTEEICEIFERFEKVIIVGDSMMRHVIGAMNVLLRKDLGYGAVTNWNFSPKERYVLSTHKISILGPLYSSQQRMLLQPAVRRQRLFITRHLQDFRCRNQRSRLPRLWQRQNRPRYRNDAQVSTRPQRS